MKFRILTLLLAVTAYPTFAAYRVGDSVGDITWTDVNNQNIHLFDDAIKNNIRVLLFNAGWCGPCNNEFRELVPQVTQFKGQPVTFISLSAEGWERGEEADSQFLSDWKRTYRIPFIVASSQGDFGRDFNPQGYIPNVAIVDSEGKLAYKAISPGTDAIIEEVKQLLGE